MTDATPSNLDNDAAKGTAETLQPVLADLIDLSLQLKQAHWNVVGPQFRSVHLELDEVVETTRDALDAVAERIAALGTVAPGGARFVAEHSGLDAYPAELVNAEDCVGLVVDRLDAVTGRMRSAIETLGETDPVSEDLVIGLAGELEQAAWMFRAQLRRAKA